MWKICVLCRHLPLLQMLIGNFLTILKLSDEKKSIKSSMIYLLFTMFVGEKGEEWKGYDEKMEISSTVLVGVMER